MPYLLAASSSASVTALELKRRGAGSETAGRGATGIRPVTPLGFAAESGLSQGTPTVAEKEMEGCLPLTESPPAMLSGCRGLLRNQGCPAPSASRGPSSKMGMPCPRMGPGEAPSEACRRSAGRMGRMGGDWARGGFREGRVVVSGDAGGRAAAFLLLKGRPSGAKCTSCSVGGCSG